MIFGVWIQLSAANERAQKFAQEFDRTRRLDEANSLARRNISSGLARLFLQASHFIVETRGASLRAKHDDCGQSVLIRYSSDGRLGTRS